MDKDRKLRSQEWFGRKDKLGFIHRSWMRGYPTAVFQNKPVIGICNSWSELASCNAHLRQVADAVKRGVWSAGGFPLEFPTISLGETFMRPSTMMFRNLMAMDVEESIRANPLDGVVLLCGCDKTTPAQLMGAASADLPAIVVPGGPMLRGMFKNKEIGSGTDVWHYWDEFARRAHQRGRMVRVGVLHVAQRRALRGDGDGFDDDQPGRSAGHDSHRLRQYSGRRLAPLQKSRSAAVNASSKWSGKTCGRHRSSRRRRSRTPSEWIWRSAARPTPSFTWSRLPRGWGSSCRCRCSMKSHAPRR